METTAQKRRPRLNPWLVRLPMLAMSAGILLILVLVGLVGAYQWLTDGLIHQGVSAYGIDLSGLTWEQAYSVLSGAYDYSERATFTLRDPGTGQTWQVTAGELGVWFDVEATVDAAFRVGRSGDWIDQLAGQYDAYIDGAPVAPIIVYDKSRAFAYMQQIAGAIDRPVRDAAIEIVDFEPVTTQGDIGRALNIDSTLDDIEFLIKTLSADEVALDVKETPPAIASAEDAAQQIRAILSGEIKMHMENPQPGDPGPWRASREAIADMIAVYRVEDEDGARYEVQFDTTQFRTFLTQLAPDLAVEPVNARYVFDEETGQISPIEESVNGRTLDVEGSIARIQQAITQADPAARDVPLKFKVSVPAAHTHATGEELGITELVVEATTYYHGSSAVRKTNIVQAASRFHGIVIAPGEEFSFNKYIGEISKETGYEEGLIIYNNKTITGVGGGVCQVSTTAFQAAFYGGYDITLRWPHAYRVSYYEYGEGAGMDATVFSPDVDFRFVNDTPYHLLIETYPSPASSTLTFKFYSTSMNRSVEKDGPYIVNGRGGTQDVTIYRTVYQDGDVLREDSFFSHYIPEPSMSSSDNGN